MWLKIIPVLWLASSAISDCRQAAALLQARDLNGAAGAAGRALAADPEYIPAISLMARIEIASGNSDAAEKRLASALEAHPGDSGLTFLLGFSRYLRNDFASALEALAHADSSDPQVILYRALATEGLGNVDAAIALYRRAIAMSRSAEPRLALARLLRREGDPGAAAHLVDEALANEPGNRDALYEKGQSLLASHAPARAAQFGERALAAPGDAPSDREIRYLLVRAYMESGDAAREARNRRIFEKLPLPLVR